MSGPEMASRRGVHSSTQDFSQATTLTKPRRGGSFVEWMCGYSVAVGITRTGDLGPIVPSRLTMWKTVRPGARLRSSDPRTGNRRESA